MNNETVKIELTMDQFCWLTNVLGATPKKDFRWHEDLSNEQWDDLVKKVLQDPENYRKLMRWADRQIELES